MSPAARLDSSAIARTLRDAGLRARHSLSQNFLADIDVLEAILAEAAPTPGRRIWAKRSNLCAACSTEISSARHRNTKGTGALSCS